MNQSGKMEKAIRATMLMWVAVIPFAAVAIKLIVFKDGSGTRSPAPESPKSVDQRQVAHPDLYQAITEHWSHAEQVRWTILYNFLMGSSILVLAWAAIYSSATGSSDFSPFGLSLGSTATWLLGTCSGAGIVLSFVWIFIVRRANSFVDTYTELGRKFENSFGSKDSSPFLAADKLRGDISRLSRSSYVNVFVAMIFLIVFLILFAVSVFG